MRGRTWTEADLETLRRMYADHTNAAIAEKLERTVVSVDQRAHLMGLKKPETYHAAHGVLAQRFTPNYIMKPVDTSDLPRRSLDFKPYVPQPIPSWFRERMETVAAIPSYKPKAMQI